jgi:hypothetical protein
MGVGLQSHQDQKAGFPCSRRIFGHDEAMCRHYFLQAIREEASCVDAVPRGQLLDLGPRPWLGYATIAVAIHDKFICLHADCAHSNRELRRATLRPRKEPKKLQIPTLALAKPLLRWIFRLHID